MTFSKIKFELTEETSPLFTTCWLSIRKMSDIRGMFSLLAWKTGEKRQQLPNGNKSQPQHRTERNAQWLLSGCIVAFMAGYSLTQVLDSKQNIEKAENSSDQSRRVVWTPVGWLVGSETELIYINKLCGRTHDVLLKVWCTLKSTLWASPLRQKGSFTCPARGAINWRHFESILL